MVSFGETRDPPPEKRASRLGNIDFRQAKERRILPIAPPVRRKRLKIQRTGANFTSALDGTLAKAYLTSQASAKTRGRKGSHGKRTKPVKCDGLQEWKKAKNRRDPHNSISLPKLGYETI